MAQSSGGFKQWLANHRFLIVYSAIVVLFLLFLNTWLWPTPDEYFYALLANSFEAAQQGILQWSDISTEHIAALSGLLWLFQQLWQPSVFWENRLIMIVFSVGIIWLVAAIGRVVLPKEHRDWMLWLLLLIPGFWIFSVRLMLDIPATFALALLLYLIIARKPSLYVGAALVNLLLFREYYVYFILPFILLIYFIDACKQSGGWSSAGVKWLMQSCTVVVPVLLTTLIFLDLNLLPYPRLLENSLIFIFGDIFRWVNYHVVLALDLVVRSIDPTVTVWQSTTPTVVESVVNTATTTTPTTTIAIPIAQVSEIQLTGQIPTGIVESQIASSATTIWTKLWLVYYYNFSEADINVVVLPFAVLGMVMRMQSVWAGWKKDYLKIRPDVIYYFLFAVFAYFNFHEATSVHGFRITLPIILALLYFAYWGAVTLLTSPKRWHQALFGLLMVGSIVGYWLTIKSIYYGSVLAQDAVLSAILVYKPYGFIALFLALAICIIIYPKWQWTHKMQLSVVVIICMFVIKFLPFALDAHRSQQLYGYDYGLSKATTALQQVMTPFTKLCGNIHAYRSQYYARDPIVTNDGVAPIVRTFSQYYPIRYSFCPFDGSFLTTLSNAQIQYVFVLNGDINQVDYMAWQEILAANPDRFTLLEDSELNGRPQWALYQVNR